MCACLSYVDDWVKASQILKDWEAGVKIDECSTSDEMALHLGKHKRRKM